MQTKELEELIKSRRSIRVWQNKKVSEETLLQALELATYAPNGGNQQNWKFYVILNKKNIVAIADAVQNMANLAGSWPESASMGEAATRMITRASFFRDAPALIAVATNQYQSDIDKVLALREKSDAQAKQIRQWRNSVATVIQSAASGIAYLLLILHQMGLGAVWMTGPMQAKGDIEKLLKMPAEMNLLALIPVGYPAETPPLKERKPIREVCEVIK